MSDATKQGEDDTTTNVPATIVTPAHITTTVTEDPDVQVEKTTVETTTETRPGTTSP